MIYFFQRRIILAALLVFPLAACSLLPQNIKTTLPPMRQSLQSDQILGQTFTTHDQGLTGIELFIAPDGPVSGEIHLHLRAGAQADQDIITTSISASVISMPAFYHFDFAPQNDSRGHDYFLLLDVEGNSKYEVGTTVGDTYLDGALYQNGTPVDAQMSFHLIYDPFQRIIGWMFEVFIWIQVVVIGILLFVLPGWAILALLFPAWESLSWGERLGLAGGASVALYPILLLWTAIFDLHLGFLYAWVPAVLAIGGLVWRNRNARLSDRNITWRRWQQSSRMWSDLAFILLIALIIGVRFLAIRSIDIPLWGDSYQHTMIAQLMVDHGGLFDSWQPYADLQTFTYHFGFHSAVTAFHWITDTSLPRATLWVGQILNVLAVLAIYPLTIRVSGGNQWAGIIAILIAGLLSPMPMYYVNWGRYTQLAGQVILPLTVLVAWTIFDSQDFSRRLAVLAWLSWGGLALAHYRILIIAIFFLIVYFVIEVRHKSLVSFIRETFVMGIGGALIFLPWYIHTFAGKISTNFANQLTKAAAPESAWMQAYNGIGDLGTYLPNGFWLLLLLSIGWGLWRRDRKVAVICLWWFANLLASNPHWLRLPGEGVINNFTIFIMSYLPAGILLGSALSWILDTWKEKFNPGSITATWTLAMTKTIPSLGLLLLMIGGSAWGASERLDDIIPMQSALVTRADIRAANWIQLNTPNNARILVNSFSAFGSSLIVGSDGGWWLPLLTKRQTNLPPLNYGTEVGIRPDYRQWINALPAEILRKGIDHSDVLAMLRERGITYVYIGQRQGRVNYDGPSILNPQQLLASAHYRLAYQQDRVWIFEVAN
ncbi:MAG: hypothetical protein HZB51_23340 [Chloroflexi bacterium]|nr:hypothetical protein [Chloroflexota bacterium]